MASKRAFEEQISALDALRLQPDDLRIDPLRKALSNRNNFVVAKAADVAREFRITKLMPALLAAFDRFFENAEKSDPQCWAKNAISRALAAMEYQEPDVFLRGMRHIQMEPVWGGRSDTAGTLRGTCALALVQCQSLSESDLLHHLIDLLADQDKAVRGEAVRAIEQVGSPSAALLLRLRAMLGHEEPEVLGACYGAVMHIEGARSIAWVASFLSNGDEAAAEAAFAIAGTRSAEGFEVLRARLESTTDPWFRSVLLSAIALTREDGALEFLLGLVQAESIDAEPAIEAIVRAMPSEGIVIRLEKLVAGNSRLERVFTVLKESAR